MGAFKEYMIRKSVLVLSASLHGGLFLHAPPTASTLLADEPCRTARRGAGRESEKGASNGGRSGL